ncbi:MAG: sugar ABC transporter substrate-binding protein [Anaerolineae bacterium]|nr:sugar ABC transporter substrate-binding protein [Anaerolineae bacterium]
MLLNFLKKVTVALSLTAVGLGGVACGMVMPDTEATELPDVVETTETVETAAQGEIVLRVATGDSGAGLVPHERIIEQFEAENPGISIMLESVEGRDYYGRLLTAIAAENAPDIVQIGDDALPQFVGQEALLPLDGLIVGDYPLDTGIYLPGVLEAGQWQGRQYLLPKDYSTLAVFYNKKIFDAYNMPYPTDDWTWDEFLETAQALTQDTDGDGNTDVWGVQLPASWTTGFEYWVAAAGGSLISPDGQRVEGYLDSPQVTEAVQFYGDLYNAHGVAPLPVDLNSFGGGNHQFENGQAAMQFFGRWPQSSLLDNEAVELGVVSPPRLGDKVNILIWGGFGIVRDSPNQEAAWRFLRFYTGQPGSEVWKDWALPAVETVAEEAGLTADPIEGVWLEQLQSLTPRGYTRTPHWERAVAPALLGVLETVIIDPEADVESILQDAARDAQRELNILNQ